MTTTLLADIVRIVKNYKPKSPKEDQDLRDLQRLISDGVDVSCRQEYRGHVTSGAVVVGDQGKVLLLQHIALDRWLLPGGHLEPSDRSVFLAAMRELLEEAGVAIVETAMTDLGSMSPLMIDAHWIPHNLSRKEPSHRHWDFRWLVHAPKIQVKLQESEVGSWKMADPIVHSAELSDRLRNIGEELRNGS